MRLYTRDVHKISDRLVNAKVAFGKKLPNFLCYCDVCFYFYFQNFLCFPKLALTDNRVWSDGLLIFYEIFKFLEEHVPEDILPPDFYRTAAFESDLKFYLGTDWKKTHADPPREVVQKYLDHLKELHANQPILLVAYVYHLYMGLLSGGQIIQKKRLIKNKLNVFTNSPSTVCMPPGYSVADFGTTQIVDLKTKMRGVVDNLAASLDAETKDAILQESREVFIWNNKIVHTVNVSSIIFFNNFVCILSFALLIYGIYLCCDSHWFNFYK